MQTLWLNNSFQKQVTMITFFFIFIFHNNYIQFVYHSVRLTSLEGKHFHVSWRVIILLHQAATIAVSYLQIHSVNILEIFCVWFNIELIEEYK